MHNVFLLLIQAASGIEEVDGGFVILNCGEYYFFRVHENIVQHPYNNKSITLYPSNYLHKIYNNVCNAEVRLHYQNFNK